MGIIIIGIILLSSFIIFIGHTVLPVLHHINHHLDNKVKILEEGKKLTIKSHNLDEIKRKIIDLIKKREDICKNIPNIRAFNKDLKDTTTLFYTWISYPNLWLCDVEIDGNICKIYLNELK
jgi:hypothetical protein